VLMTDLGKTLVRDQSIGMAKGVMDELGRALRLKHRELSYAPFYVLARTKMPAVLVEVAFITNPTEERLLGDPSFREKAAENIAAGLLDYRAASQVAAR
jgi:N-acetylmuramoyl-L-alanine amidase